MTKPTPVVHTSDILATNPLASFSAEHVFKKGQNVLIRAVTFHYIGTIQDIDESFITLYPACWLANSGRFGNALRTGELSEYEEMPDGVLVKQSAIVDATPWRHDVPTGDK